MAEPEVICCHEEYDYVMYHYLVQCTTISYSEQNINIYIQNSSLVDTLDITQ